MYVFLLDRHARFPDFPMASLFLKQGDFAGEGKPIHITKLEQLYEALMPDTVMMEESVPDWALILCDQPAEELDLLNRTIDIKQPYCIVELHLPPSGARKVLEWRPQEYFVDPSLLRSPSKRERVPDVYRLVLSLDFGEKMYQLRAVLFLWMLARNLKRLIDELFSEQSEYEIGHHNVVELDIDQEELRIFIRRYTKFLEICKGALEEISTRENVWYTNYWKLASADKEEESEIDDFDTTHFSEIDKLQEHIRLYRENSLDFLNVRLKAMEEQADADEGGEREAAIALEGPLEIEEVQRKEKELQWTLSDEIGSTIATIGTLNKSVEEVKKTLEIDSTKLEKLHRGSSLFVPYSIALATAVLLVFSQLYASVSYVDAGLVNLLRDIPSLCIHGGLLLLLLAVVVRLGRIVTKPIEEEETALKENITGMKDSMQELYRRVSRLFRLKRRVKSLNKTLQELENKKQQQIQKREKAKYYLEQLAELKQYVVTCLGHPKASFAEEGGGQADIERSEIMRYLEKSVDSNTPAEESIVWTPFEVEELSTGRTSFELFKMNELGEEDLYGAKSEVGGMEELLGIKKVVVQRPKLRQGGRE